MPGHSGKLRVGEIAFDPTRQILGEVMEVYETHYALRPLRGGIEWDADLTATRRPTTAEQLTPALATRNALSRQSTVSGLTT
ncbi:hypothetical protein [Streptomyces clavuligerus]|uniref:Uncharacterized protein n=1 Tax=Streptomyces clavuligerus TaxID=1901 RepID=B5GYM4_STRCL|nr:hypothetical protein [Streptomyces clavuligerus]ANW20777.1 hypothetical protein BB341_22485 [Streptomyces clavuligerus]AXU15403.1 hypothetical protein D1794_23380 [Streptomyces clavuligerus]EDY51420.1 hypothetical protein SSCG_04578 [Streptomyces clavuligerus]EFG06187.1 Hypothetical protein SCLAV_1108 [Streptomyces clavuligerus]MBY6305497.1 hypothetical protein [Streptomyces clavuligerus]